VFRGLFSLPVYTFGEKIVSVLTKLPIIVEPREYKLIKDKITLGDYLKNNIYYIDSLFIDKIELLNSQYERIKRYLRYNIER